MDPQEIIKITSAVCTILAVSSTIARLVIRWNRDTMWYDDAWAFLSMLILIVQFVAVYLPFRPLKTGEARYYLIALGFVSIIWSARLSLLFSLVRLEFDWWWERIWRVVSVVFIIIWLFLWAQILWECLPKDEWRHLPVPQCNLSDAVAIVLAVTDVIGDGICLFIPLRMFRTLRNRDLRIRLMLLFSTCIITTIVSLVHSYYILVKDPPNEVISGVVENTISLMVCNVPLLVARIFKLNTWYEERKSSENRSFWPTWLKGKTITFREATMRERTQYPDDTAPDLTTISINLRLPEHDSSTTTASTASKLTPSKPDGGTEGDGRMGAGISANSSVNHHVGPSQEKHGFQNIA